MRNKYIEDIITLYKYIFNFNEMNLIQIKIELILMFDHGIMPSITQQSRCVYAIVFQVHIKRYKNPIFANLSH